ncbi:MAG: DUF6691 family protein [Gammaproteobacteria bacterium]
MIKHLVGFLSGAIFGLGLAVSEMMNPEKVLAFLDVAGDWDPSLALVMGGAVAVTLLTFGRVLKLKSPLFASRFEIPGRGDVDTPLIIGAVIFGAGWGIAGYCPGPAVAALTTGVIEPWIFIVAFIVGNSLSIGLDQLQQRITSTA